MIKKIQKIIIAATISFAARLSFLYKERVFNV